MTAPREAACPVKAGVGKRVEGHDRNPPGSPPNRIATITPSLPHHWFASPAIAIGSFRLEHNDCEAGSLMAGVRMVFTRFLVIVTIQRDTFIMEEN
jgi:hypothetical protein